MNKSFVDYVIRDYSKPMGVATYKTSKDMSEQLKKALPPIEELQRILDEKSDQQNEMELMDRLNEKAEKGNLMLDE